MLYFMALFPITRRTDMDLELTRNTQKIIPSSVVGFSSFIPLAIIVYLVLKK